MKTCPKCNRTYPDDAPGFCPQDGTPLALAVQSGSNCQKCGYPIQPAAPFCANCGSPRQVVSSQQPPQPFPIPPAQPLANQPGYGAPYQQNPQNLQPHYAVQGQFP